MAAPPETPRGYLGITRRPTRREWRRALIVFAVGVVVLTLLMAFLRPRAHLLALGTAAPAISLTAVGGSKVTVAAAASGRPYIVEFFGAGCAHCQESAAQLCDETVPVYAVDAAKDSEQTVADYRQRYAPRCTHPMLLDPDARTAIAYGVSVVPTIYLVKDGKVVYASSGLDGVTGVRAAAQQALGG
jgi:thiol-disulfide isomerase/thioredoxin